MLRPGGHHESPDLLDAEHRWQSAEVADKHEPARQVRPIERHREEEAQRRPQLTPREIELLAIYYAGTTR